MVCHYIPVNAVMSALPFIPLFQYSMRSMSATCSVPFHVSVRTSNPVTKHSSNIVMLKQNHVPGKKASTVQIRSFSKDKVFEDRSQGVICHRDENGEIVCEGYDEGPRLPGKIPVKSYCSRDAEILDILQDRWLRIVSGDGFGFANKRAIIVQDDS